MTKFKTYVWSERGTFKARVAKGSKSKTVARKAIRTALVARDMIDPKNRIPLTRTGVVDDLYHEYSTDMIYKMRPPLGHKRPKVSAVSVLRPGDHVLITGARNFPGHGLRRDSVGIVIRQHAPSETDQPHGPMWVVRGVHRTWGDPMSQIVNQRDLERTSDPAEPPVQRDLDRGVFTLGTA